MWKFIEMAEKEYGTQDPQNGITGCRPSFFYVWQSVFLCWKFPPMQRIISKSISATSQDRDQERETLLCSPQFREG